MKATNTSKGLFLMATIAIYTNASAQPKKCTYTHLSTKYNFTLTYDDTGEPVDGVSISGVTLTIITKADKKIVQKIPVRYDGSDDGYLCISRSYSTGYNRNAPIEDGDIGDVIVADLNFDGKEDIAIKRGAYPTGAGTEWFDFYIQTDDGKFVKDNFLTSRMRWFPDSIDSKDHTLTTALAVGAVPHISYSKFKYNTATKKWKQVK